MRHIAPSAGHIADLRSGRRSRALNIGMQPPVWGIASRCTPVANRLQQDRLKCSCDPPKKFQVHALRRSAMQCNAGHQVAAQRAVKRAGPLTLGRLCPRLLTAHPCTRKTLGLDGIKSRQNARLVNERPLSRLVASSPYLADRRLPMARSGKLKACPLEVETRTDFVSHEIAVRVANRDVL